VFLLKSKSQAALEFLTTYAWAFLVIIITIAALAYFGVLSPSKLLPERCNFGPEFQCINYIVSATSDSIRLKLKNGAGTQINVQSITLSSDGNQISCTKSPIEYTNELWGGSFWSQSGMTAWNANCVNDGNTASSCFHTDSSGVGTYIQLDTGAGNERGFTKIEYWAQSPYSAIWDIQYSDDGSIWSTAYTGWNSGADGAYSVVEFDYVGEHRYWRLYKTNPAAGGGWQFEIQFSEGMPYSLSKWEPDKVLELTWKDCSLETLGMVQREKKNIFITIDYYPARAGSTYTKQSVGEIFTTIS